LRRPTNKESGDACVAPLCSLFLDFPWWTNKGEKLMDWLGQRSVHPSVGKLWRTKQARFVASLAAQIALDASLAHDSDNSQGEFWRYHILNSPRMSLGGGTDEIQKNTIGERALGLPREPS